MKWKKDESQSDAHQPQHQTQEQQQLNSPLGSSIGEKTIDSPPFPLQVKSIPLQLVALVIHHLPSTHICGVQSTPILPQSDWSNCIFVHTVVNLPRYASVPSLLVSGHCPRWLLESLVVSWQRWRGPQRSISNVVNHMVAAPADNLLCGGHEVVELRSDHILCMRYDSFHVLLVNAAWPYWPMH
jgi:hypothetical protein